MVTDQPAAQDGNEVWINSKVIKSDVEFGRLIVHEVALYLAKADDSPARHAKARAFVRAVLKKPEASADALAEAANELRGSVDPFTGYRMYWTQSELKQLAKLEIEIERGAALRLYPGCVAYDYAVVAVSSSDSKVPTYSKNGSGKILLDGEAAARRLVGVELLNAIDNAIAYLDGLSIPLFTRQKSNANFAKGELAAAQLSIKTKRDIQNEKESGIYTRMSPEDANNVIHAPYLNGAYKVEKCDEIQKTFAADPEFVKAKQDVAQYFRSFMTERLIKVLGLSPAGAR
jgi:hypothetical protein